MTYNLLSYSEEADHPVWEGRAYGTISLAAVEDDTRFAPNGTQTADLIVFGSGASARLQRVTVDPSTEYTFSIFIKAGTAARSGLATLIAEGADETFLRFNSTGTVALSETEYPEDWVRVFRTFTTGADITSIEVGIGTTVSQESLNFIQWGAQLVLGAVAQTYEQTPIPTATPEPTPEPTVPPVEIVEPPHPVPILPALDDTFHELYTEYSVYHKNVIIPDHFLTYTPDNSDDGACISIITPEPDLGAKKWTHHGKWITIGIFRDVGRSPAVKPPSTSLRYWVRSGNKLVITDSKKHQLIVGEKVIIEDMNVGYHETTVQTIIDDYVFIVGCLEVGNVTGNVGTYQGLRLVDFAAEQVVFRLLPSFKLVPWSFVKSIFESSSPSLTLTKRTLFEITRGTEVKVSNAITRSVNFKVPNATASESSFALRKRFNQRYDENGKPLKAAYDDLGNLKPPYQIDNKYRNNPALFNNTSDNFPMNYRVIVYDFYGVDLNDHRRGPYFTTELITRDLRAPSLLNNVKRLTDEFGNVYYTGLLYDEFGNVVIGIQENNALITRQNVLPLTLDSFNHPVKEPVSRRTV